MLQEWLHVLGCVEPESPAQQRQRQRLLREAADLRGKLAAARQQAGTLQAAMQQLTAGIQGSSAQVRLPAGAGGVVGAAGHTRRDARANHACGLPECWLRSAACTCACA